jgi:hypothetical protein
MQSAGASTVVNVDIKLAARALPATSSARVVTVTVYSVPSARLPDGENVYVFPDDKMEPAT